MEQNKNKSSNFLAISILAAAVIISGSFIYGNSIKSQGGGQSVAQVGSRSTGQENNNGSPVAPDVTKLIDDDVILGDPNAPVLLVEFGDFECPFCRKFTDETVKKVREEYIATGKVKMVYRDFPLRSIHPNAQSSALAAGCAADQGKYWQYHDMLFENQSRLSAMDYVSEAGKLGMDTAQFNQCFAGQKYADEVEKDYQDALSLGLRGTPGVFVNEKLFPGAFPYETFKQAIEDALKAAGS